MSGAFPSSGGVPNTVGSLGVRDFVSTGITPPLGTQAFTSTAFVYSDRVGETSTGTGTGGMALGGALVAAQTFSGLIPAGAHVSYAIDNTTVPAEWEVGDGIYTADNVLQRISVLDSSAAGALVNFSAGAKNIFVTLSASSIAALAATTTAFNLTQKLYYVDSVAGNDGNSGLTTSAPWASLAQVYANRALYGPGSTIALKRGSVFLETLNIDSQSGSPGHPIVYTAYGSGDIPVIDAQSTRGWPVYISQTAAYITLDSIRAINGVNDGIYVIANTVNITNLTFTNCVSELNGRDGFGLESNNPGTLDIGSIEYDNCSARKNGRAGFFVNNVAATVTPVGINYYNCKAIYSGQTQGNHGFSAIQSTNIHYYKCEASYTNIDPSTGLVNGTGGTEGIGFVFDDFTGSSTVKYCYAHHNVGYGIALAHQASNNVGAYNVVVLNSGGGIVVNGNAAGSNNTLVYNNTIVSNTGNGLEVQTLSSGNIIKNNLISSNTGWGILFSASGITGYTVATNLIYNNTAGATSNVTGATGTITTNPTLDANYAPLLGSPAISAGLNLGSSYTQGLTIGGASWPTSVSLGSQGATFDIGAFVFP